MVERKSIEKERKRRGARSSLVVAFSSVFFFKGIYGRERRICFCWDLFLLGFSSSFGGLLLHFFCLINLSDSICEPSYVLRGLS